MEIVDAGILPMKTRRRAFTTTFKTKIVVMKPEIILQSSHLDILFHNRNKAYGAYVLRRHYNRRLLHAMLLTFSLVFLFFIFKGGAPSAETPLHKPIFVKDHTLENINENRPPELPKPVPTNTKQVAQVQNPSIKIVPDELATPIKTVDQLAARIIGTGDNDGVDGRMDPPEILSTAPTGTGIQPVATPEPAEVLPLSFAEEMPEFPGGKEAFMRFMLRNLKQPDHLQVGEEIVVRVQFVVDIEGAIAGIHILQSGGILDSEVIRVINKMPKWKPGRQNGRSVAVYFQLPVTFVGME
jgi:protein TonB